MELIVNQWLNIGTIMPTDNEFGDYFVNVANADVDKEHLFELVLE